MRYGFGIDLGGTTVKMAFLDENGTMRDKWEIPTRTEDKGKNILPDIAASVKEYMKKENLTNDQIIGIGIGVPGPISEAGIVNKCVNLGWEMVDLHGELSVLTGLPVKGGNDANVAALGECWKGGGHGATDLIMATLGTGVGGGIINNGRIIAGFHGAGGEIGHFTVNFDEKEPCACGKYGCLEQYASANGIVRMAKVMLSQCDTPSRLRELENFTAKDICDLAREGEEMAGRIVDRCGEYLGRAMSFVSCTTDPDVFVVGGGMSRAGAVVTNAALKYFRKYAFHVSAGTSIVIAELGNDAGIYGSAKMVLHN